VRYLIIILLITGCSDNKDQGQSSNNIQNVTNYPVSDYLVTRKSELITSGGETLYLSEFQGSLALYYGGDRAIYNSCMTSFEPHRAEDCAKATTKTTKDLWGWPCQRAGYPNPSC